MSEAVKSTVLNAVHKDLKGRMVPFGGYEMPVQYTSIVDEHRAVRTAAGLFDLCHMGRYEVRGSGAIAAVNQLITNNVAAMKPGQIRYALMLNDQGGVRDDILVYRMQDSVFLVVNAGNREKLLGWIGERLDTSGDVEFEDRSEELAMIAVQGPRAEELLVPHTRTTWIENLSQLAYYGISDAQFAFDGVSTEGYVSRTGYTGEDGFELYVPAETAADIWNELLAGAGGTLIPCGLGSRDTLRLEAGMPLYGHELNEETNPLEAGLNFAVKLKKKSGFIGADALKAVAEAGPRRRLRGFKVDGKRVAREHMPVLHGETQVGETTSGAPSPTLGCNIAMAYVDASVAEAAPLHVDIRGTRVGLIPNPVPFYSRKR